jgi:hypothetical protein
MNIWVFVKNISFQHVDKFNIRTSSVWVVILKESSWFRFLFLWHGPGFIVISSLILLFATSRNLV